MKKGLGHQLKKNHLIPLTQQKVLVVFLARVSRMPYLATPDELG